MLYLTIALIAMLIISIVNCLFFIQLFGSVWQVILNVVFAVGLLVIIDALVAFIVRWMLPKKWFLVDNNVFTPSKKLTNFYEKLGVREWKQKVPDLGGMTGFKKDNISDPKNNEFISRYIVEANYGIAIHLISIVVGFFTLFVNLSYTFNILLPVAIVNALLNYMSFITLRYNLSKLRTIYKYNERPKAAVN